MELAARSSRAAKLLEMLFPTWIGEHPTLCISILILGLGSLSACAAEAGFRRVVVSSFGRVPERHVELVLSEAEIHIREKKDGPFRLDLPYTALKKLSYGTTKRHRLLSGAGLMMASPAAGIAMAATKSGAHWLVLEYDSGRGPSTIVFRLHKSESERMVAGLRGRVGIPIEVLDPASIAFDPTSGSTDVDSVVAHPRERVEVALRSAMESYGCTGIVKEKGRIRCDHLVRSERTGVGGERITAELTEQGGETRVKIVTDKRATYRRKNWSAPIYAEMKRALESDAP